MNMLADRRAAPVQGVYGCGAHSDYGVITLLAQDDTGASCCSVVLLAAPVARPDGPENVISVFLRRVTVRSADRALSEARLCPRPHS